MTRKQRRLVLISAGVGVLGLAAGLVLWALRDSIVFFNSPTDLAEKHLAPGTRLRLGEKARLTIDRYLINAGGELTLQSGAMLFDRAEGAPPAAIQIRAPFGLIAVRGTRFFAGPSGAVFGVFVARGAVTVASGFGAVTLRAGEGTDLRYPGDAPSPPARWGAQT